MMAFVCLFLFLFTLVSTSSMAEDHNFNCPTNQTNSSQLTFEHASYLLHLAEQNQFTNLPLTLSFTQHAIKMLTATSQNTTTTNLADHAYVLEQLTATASNAQSIFQEAIERALRPFDADQDSLDRISTDIHMFLNSGNISMAGRLAKRGYDMWSSAPKSFIIEYQSAFIKWLLQGCCLLRHCMLLALDDAALQIGRRLITMWQHHESLFSIVFATKKYNKKLSEAVKHYDIVLLKHNSNAVAHETQRKLVQSLNVKLGADTTSTESMYNWGNHATKLYRGLWKTVAVKTGTNANNKATSLKECRRKICQEMNSSCNSEGLPFQAFNNNNNSSSNSNNGNNGNNSNNNNSDCHSSIGVLDATGLKADQIVDILLREYIAEGRPALLKNAAASLGLPSLTSLTMDQLLLRFGGSIVSTTKASNVAIKQTELYEYPMTMSIQSTLVDFYSTFMNDATKGTAADCINCDPPYVFGTLDDVVLDDVVLFDRKKKKNGGFNALNVLGDWTSTLHETGRFRAASLDTQLTNSMRSSLEKYENDEVYRENIDSKHVNRKLFKKHLKSMKQQQLDTETRNSALFYVGGALSGTYFHSHTNALNVLINGSKRWWLVPPNVLFGPDSVGSMVEWYTKYKLTLPFTPLECTQRSGDILFVPTEWNHATMNLENVFGYAVEIGKDNALFTTR